MTELGKRTTEELRADFQKRSWEDLFPDANDTAVDRIEKREKLERLLKVWLSLGWFWQYFGCIDDF